VKPVDTVLLFPSDQPMTVGAEGLKVGGIVVGVVAVFVVNV
jgi:hypothetical protein